MSAAAAAASPSIRYQGPGEGGELWGGTQADFAIVRPGRPDREVAVLLQHAAAAELARAAGADDGDEFRARAASLAGAAWLSALAASGERPDSFAVISAATLRERPELAEAVRAGAA